LVKIFIKILSEVDLSCCGVSYDGELLFEQIDDAVLHAKKRVYVEMNNNEMNSRHNKKLEDTESSYDRINKRIAKLEDRGWRRYRGSVAEFQIGRLKKLEML